MSRGLKTGATNPTNRGYVEITSDGVKTYGQLLNSLFALVDMSKINSKSVLTNYTNVFQISDIQSGDLIFSRQSCDTTYFYLATIKLSTSSAIYSGYCQRANSTWNISELSANVIPTGRKIRIDY